jgi:hypothetical protein
LFAKPQLMLILRSILHYFTRLHDRRTLRTNLHYKIRGLSLLFGLRTGLWSLSGFLVNWCCITLL